MPGTQLNKPEANFSIAMYPWQFVLSHTISKRLEQELESRFLNLHSPGRCSFKFFSARWYLLEP